MRKSSCLLIAMTLMSIMLFSNTVLASKNSSKAHFTVVSAGRCLVQYDAFFGPPLPDQVAGDYNEWESPVGFFMFAGKALTEDWSGGPPADPSLPNGDWHMISPGTLEAHGYLKVAWSHEGENYAIQGEIIPRSQTYGLIEPDQNMLWIKGPEGGMDFTGSYEAGSLSIPLKCGGTFIVVPSGGGPGYYAEVRIQFPGWPTSLLMFYWFEAGLDYLDVHIPAAVVFNHKVTIK